MDLVSHALAGALVGQALSPAPEVQWACTALGAAAGLLPDLDGATRLIGKHAALRHHRVLLHGLPGTVPLAALLAAVAWACTQGLDYAAAFAVAWAGLLSHLGLDALTSAGTGVLYPFSRRRFALRSHFIVDPVLWLLAAAGLFLQQPQEALLLLAMYFGTALLLRAAIARRARRHLRALGLAPERVSVQPRIAAPWRWLVLAQVGRHYLYGHATAFAMGSWRRTAAGNDADTVRTARRHPVLAAFLDTCDFPRFEWAVRGGQLCLLVEDIKWWLELPYRPLAFSAQIDASGRPRRVVQSHWMQRAPWPGREAPPGQAGAAPAGARRR